MQIQIESRSIRTLIRKAGAIKCRLFQSRFELFLSFLLVGSVLVLVACSGDKSLGRASVNRSVVDQPETWQIHLKPVLLKAGTQLACRETIYLPVYSSIYTHDHELQKVDLAETVSIRNTDFKEPILLTSVRHYRTDGSLEKEYIRRPLQVDPMATADFVVPKFDTTGGSGANFIIEWVSKRKVTKPITESIMIFAASSHSVSFLSRGEVIQAQADVKVTHAEEAKWLRVN